MLDATAPKPNGASSQDIPAGTTHLVVKKGGDSLFGKIVKFIKQEGEYAITEIEYLGEKIEAKFHVSQVIPSTPPAVPVVAPAVQPLATPKAS